MVIVEVRVLPSQSVWLLDKTKSIEQILAEQGTLSDADRQLLVPLVQRHIDNHDGDAEKSLATLSSIGSVAGDLRSLDDPDIEVTLSFVSTEQRDSLFTLPFDPSTLPPGSSAADQGSAQYRVLRPHAKGGLGEVSVAEDTELNREVALKVIQPQLAHDESYRTRFQPEDNLCTTVYFRKPGVNAEQTIVTFQCFDIGGGSN